MTILNVWVSPERAVIAVDTLSTRPRSLEPWTVSKMIPFVHCNAILSGCGNMALMLRVFWQLAQQQGDFDSMALAMPQIVDPAYAECLADLPRLGFTEDQMSPYSIVALVGWSESLGEMCGQYQVRHPGESAFRAREAIDSIMHPNVGEAGVDHDLSTADGMAAQARHQVAWGRHTYPKWAIGGRLSLAERQRDSMTITSRTLD